MRCVTTLYSAVAHLGCHVVQGACAGDRPLLIDVDGEPKVRDFDHLVAHEQDILRLDVAVDDALRPTRKVPPYWFDFA